jgi:hypothetical protein
MTAVEWLYNNLKSHFEHDGDLLEVVQMSFKQAKELEKKQKIEFACKVVELSSENYIQGKTTEQIAKELIKSE